MLSAFLLAVVAVAGRGLHTYLLFNLTVARYNTMLEVLSLTVLIKEYIQILAGVLID